MATCIRGRSVAALCVGVCWLFAVLAVAGSGRDVRKDRNGAEMSEESIAVISGKYSRIFYERYGLFVWSYLPIGSSPTNCRYAKIVIEGDGSVSFIGGGEFSITNGIVRYLGVAVVTNDGKIRNVVVKTNEVVLHAFIRTFR